MAKKNEVFSIRIESVDEKQVPDLVKEQFSRAVDLKKQIQKAQEKIWDAKEDAINSVEPKTISKKSAIENLQVATLDLANAQESVLDAQIKSFEYQQTLAEISKFLFRLGLTNIALNRAVVNELEAKLRKASKEELNEIERAEIENLIKRLKVQQDIDQKQTELTQIVKDQASVIEKQEKEISKLKTKIESQDKEIKDIRRMLKNL